jgi:hypothetical protein
MSEFLVSKALIKGRSNVAKKLKNLSSEPV